MLLIELFKRFHCHTVTVCAAKWPISCVICHDFMRHLSRLRRSGGSGVMCRESYPQGRSAIGVLMFKTVTDDAWSTSFPCVICHASCVICHDSVDNFAPRVFEEGFGTGAGQVVTNDAWIETGCSRAVVVCAGRAVIR